jgi:hypothetical protein
MERHPEINQKNKFYTQEFGIKDRKFPLLKYEEEEFYTKTSPISIIKRDTEDTLELEELIQNFWYGKPIEYLHNEIMILYYPEIESLMKDPDAVLDKKDLVKDDTPWILQPVYHPKTNLERIEEIREKWKTQEVQCPEYKEWKRVRDRSYELNENLKRYQEDLKRYEDIKTLIQEEKQRINESIIETFESLILPKLSYEDYQKERNSPQNNKTEKTSDGTTVSEKPKGIKALYIPFTKDGVNWEIVNVTRESYQFRPYQLFTIKRGTSSWNDLVAAIYENKIQFRTTKEEMEAIQTSLKFMADDPEEFFATFGKKAGTCLFCGKTLTDKKSLDDGYGKVCAKYIANIHKNF